MRQLLPSSARRAWLAVPAAAVALSLSGRAPAAESYDACRGFVASLPAVISTQGVWCLDQDLATAQSTGIAIDIQVNNVTLDCNGYKIGGLAAGPTSGAIGVKAAGRVNVTVRGCNVRGFRRGIDLSGSGHVVEGNRLESNNQVGIVMTATPGLVRDNLVFDTDSLEFAASGILATGDVDVIDNTIDGVGGETPYDMTTGITAADSHYATIAGNRIRNLVNRHANGASYGIRFLGGTAGSRSVVRGNDVQASAVETYSLIGIDCQGGAYVTTANVVAGWTLGLNGCQSHGDIVAAP